MKRFLFALILFASPAFGSAANIYLSQSGGTVACNGTNQTTSAYTFFNTVGNWGAGGTQIGAGTTVWIVGTITAGANTQPFTFQGSGSSGNPITLKWCNNAILQAPYFAGALYSGSGGINTNNQSWIVIDGAGTGVVQNTANGTSPTYANQQGSTLVAVQGGSNITVQNLIAQNAYVKTTTADTAGTCTSGGIIAQDASNVTIQNSTVTWACNNINWGFDGTMGTVNVLIKNNTVTNGCHEITVGDGSGSSTASGVTISGNTVTFNTIWTDPSQACHGDLLGPIDAFNAGSTLSNLTINNNTLNGTMCTTAGSNCTAYIFLTGSMSTVNIFNNIIYGQNGSQFESLIRLGAGRTDNTGTIATVGIYNNTIDCGGQFGQQNYGVKWSATGTALTSHTLKNNIITNCQWGLNAADSTTGSWSWLTANNNDYYNNGFVAQSATGGTYTFAAWNTAGFDAAGSPNNPLFGTNYVLSSGSAAIGLGANLTSLSITALDSDIIGVARPASGVWDGGAKQFNSTPPPTWNQGITIQGSLLPPTNLQIVSIDGVPITEAFPAEEMRRWRLLAYQPDQRRSW